MRPTEGVRPRPPMSTSADKGKSSAYTSDSYAQTILSNVHFKPQTSVETLERIHFGKFNLICFPNSNLSFKILPESRIDRPQKCLTDNLWQAYNKKDIKYFIACLNALSQYFTDKNTEKKFKFYVVIHGKTNRVLQTWQEVIDSIKDVKNPLFKGFTDFYEALDYARGILGLNYHISAALKQTLTPNTNPQYKIQKDTDKIIFCDHCETMTEGFKRLNAKCDALMKEKEQLLRLLHKDTTDKGKQPETSSPFQEKMDEMGVHSPLNANKPTVSGIGTASPVLTATGKDTSSPLKAVTLPKSEEDEPETPPRRKLIRKRKTVIKKKTIEDILKNALKNMIKEAEQDKQIDSQFTRTENPMPSPRQSQDGSDDEDLFQDSQDPNEGYDTAMSFDSIAVDNLDTIG